MSQTVNYSKAHKFAIKDSVLASHPAVPDSILAVRNFFQKSNFDVTEIYQLPRESIIVVDQGLYH